MNAGNCPRSHQLSLDELDLAALLTTLFADQQALIAAWQGGQRGSWGAIAAQAIVATSQRVGRKLTASERRLVWQQTWAWLIATRDD